MEETIRESKLVFGGAFGRGSAVRSSLLHSVLPYVTICYTIFDGGLECKTVIQIRLLSISWKAQFNQNKNEAATSTEGIKATNSRKT